MMPDRVTIVSKRHQSPVRVIQPSGWHRYKVRDFVRSGSAVVEKPQRAR